VTSGEKGVMTKRKADYEADTDWKIKPAVRDIKLKEGRETIGWRKRKKRERERERDEYERVRKKEGHSKIINPSPVSTIAAILQHQGS
jgi:hypothetical protein